jgi:hypothetical protein
MQRLILLLGVLGLALFAPGRPVFAAEPPVFLHNGFVVYGPFERFFSTNGAVALFGAPLSDAYIEAETGLRVQIFGHAVFELHGDTVQLRRLGSLAAGEYANHPAFAWRMPEQVPPEHTFFPESGHSLGGAFAWYHQQHGGVALLGYPISEEFFVAAADGSTQLRQYFERAVLSYDPVAATVQREPLGERYAAQQQDRRAQPTLALQSLSSVTMRYAAGTPDGANIELAAQRLHAAFSEPGTTFSFLATLGEISEATGYQRGTAIVNGEIVHNEVGGGICTVSTLLYRAAWSAGLPIIERRAHRYALRAYADAPGFDAAVYAPSQDLRISNNTGEPIFVSVTAHNGVATLTLWGRGDGRSVGQAAPIISNDGLTIERSRTITWANGQQHREHVVTRYEPLPQPKAPPPPADPGAQGPS